MYIYLNGNKVFIEKNKNLFEIIKTKYNKIDNIIVEYNKTILSKEELKNKIAEEKDQVEVLVFTGGG